MGIDSFHEAMHAFVFEGLDEAGLGATSGRVRILSWCDASGNQFVGTLTGDRRETEG